MYRRTALAAALLLAGCAQQPVTDVTPTAMQAQRAVKNPQMPPACAATPGATAAYTVQGSGARSSLVGQTVMVQGVVTGDYQATSQLRGFFLQDLTGDGDDTTSDAVFVFSTTPVNAGEFVRVTGTVQEFQGQTQLGNVTAVQVCASGYTAPSTKVNLPVASTAEFEALEGMAVHFEQTLTVTEVFALARFGELMLSADGRLFNPTNGNVETTQEQNNLRRIILDDASSVQNPSTVPYLTENTPNGTRRVGDNVKKLEGVLSEAFGAYRIQPLGAPTFVNANKRTAQPEPVGGTLKVASFNVLNYFTDFGSRGATNQVEFIRQQAKIVAAIQAIDADVLGLIEMQNNGDVALENLVSALNAAYGTAAYSAVLTGSIGTDAIKLAIIYKPDRVNPVGTFRVDANPIMDRPTLAQTFRQAGTNGVFTIAVNHFKSKSSCPTSGDVDTGQGCWNQKRVQQAHALAAFAQQLRDETGDDDVLLMGDLNAYGMEDPITVLQTAGYESLNLRIPAEKRYSYVFQGQSGYLDHALASASLAAQVTGVTEWHINSDEPVFLDYNVEFKNHPSCTSSCRTPDLYAPTPYRSSDHDPVVVGLNLTPDPTAQQ